MTKNGERTMLVLLGVFFTLAGFGLVMGGYIHLGRNRALVNLAKSSGSITTAEVSNVIDYSLSHKAKEKKFAIFVRYNVNGREYEGQLGGERRLYEKGLPVGGEITIYYDPGNPELFAYDDTFTGKSMMVVGLIIFLGAIIPLGIFMANSLSSKRLINSGELVMVEINNITYSGGFVNGEAGRVIICGWDGRTFKSRAVYLDAAAEIKRLGLKQLPVYIDRNNPDKYYMDTSSLLQ